MKTLIIMLAMLVPLPLIAQPGPPENLPTPAQKADKAVRAQDGTLVRVVGAEFDKDDAVIQGTDVGDVVEVQADGRVMCNVVIYARPVNKSVFYGDEELVGTIPDVPGLKLHFGKNGGSWPWLYHGTCDGANICVWNVLLAGEACRIVGSLPHYVASTLKEMWDLPSVRERMLVTDGTCKDDEGKDVPCAVVVGDPRVIPGRKVRFPHAFAGRWGDLNFRQRLKGKYLERVRPDKLDADGKVILRGVGGPP